jgi:hypothetical protein
MQQNQQISFITTEAKAWLNRSDGSSEVLRVVSKDAPYGQQAYELYPAYEQNVESVGRVLFDVNGYWIYDGRCLSISEQEQIAAFIMNYIEKL